MKDKPINLPSCPFCGESVSLVQAIGYSFIRHDVSNKGCPIGTTNICDDSRDNLINRWSYRYDDTDHR